MERLLGLARRPAAGHLAALLTGLLLAAPAVFAARWQILDDGLILSHAFAERDSPMNQVFRDSGRNYYGHGLYFAAQGAAFGHEVRGYYAVAALIFAGTCWLVFAVGRGCGAPPAVALLATAAFALSSPVPENLYSLFKLEPRLTFLLLLSLYGLLGFVRSSGRWRRAGALALSGASLVACPLFGKETFVLVAPAAVGAAVVCLPFMRRADPALKRGVLLYAGLTLLAVGAYVATDRLMGVKRLSEGTYTGQLVRLTADRAELREKARTIRRDVYDVPALAALALATSLVGWVVAWRRGAGLHTFVGLVCALYAVLSLAFLVVGVRWLQVYYFYPPAALAVVAVAAGWPAAGAGPRWLRTAAGCALLAGVAWAGSYGAFMNYNRATALRLWETVNDRALSAMAALPPGSRVYTNYPKDHEAHGNMRVILREIYQRPDFLTDSICGPDLRQKPAPGDYVFVRYAGENSRDPGGRDLPAPTLAAIGTDLAKLGVPLESVGYFEVKKSRLYFPSLRARFEYRTGWVAYRVVGPSAVPGNARSPAQAANAAATPRSPAS